MRRVLLTVAVALGALIWAAPEATAQKPLPFNKTTKTGPLERQRGGHKFVIPDLEEGEVVEVRIEPVFPGTMPLRGIVFPPGDKWNGADVGSSPGKKYAPKTRFTFQASAGSGDYNLRLDIQKGTGPIYITITKKAGGTDPPAPRRPR